MANDFGNKGDFRKGGFSQGGAGKGNFGGGRGGENRGRDGGRFTFDRKRFLERARAGVGESIRSRDNLLVQTVGSIDDLNKSANLLFERLSEWYGIYFPELRLSDQKKYLNAILVIDKKNASADALREVLGESSEIISQKAKASMGADLPPADLDEIRRMARMILSLYELRGSIEAYQEKLAIEICPNISHIAGAALAAKLVAESGGLQRLAQLPASTVQVIGAEKALFKHLRTGSKPPKHGVIFQHPLISTSPKNVRGKIARALATKIAIGAKADAYTKRFIAEKLKAQFDARANAVLGNRKPEQK